MSFDETINAYFVSTIINKINDNSVDDFMEALTLLRNNVPEANIRKIKASEGLALISTGNLTKKDVFIFNSFEGEFFEQLQLTKSTIIGTRCLITCLLKCEPVPSVNSPIYTTAMRDLKICSSGLTETEKERIRQLVQWMGGHYYRNLGRSLTHLISNNVRSAKYEYANLNNFKVMHVDWVYNVWERCCVANVTATDEEFNKYRLPIFFDTNITCTGIESGKKEKIDKLVSENGGTYHRAFRSTLVDIVITEKSKTDSEKYKAAMRFNKDILLPEWIFDSVKKGYALPMKSYQVKSLKVSTPTKTDQTIADFTTADRTQLTDISRISVNGAKTSNQNVTINESIMSSCNLKSTPRTFVKPTAPVSSTAGISKDLQREVFKKAGAGIQYKMVLNDICPKKVKEAGLFLDGCCIYLSGFDLDEKEKLNKILKGSGAIRYDALNEEITHIIVGQLDEDEYKQWKSDGLYATIHIVSLDWLIESIKMKHVASEVVYRVSLPTAGAPDMPSPTSKRTLRSMNSSFKQPEKPIKKNLFDKKMMLYENESDLLKPMASSTEYPLDNDDHGLIAHYSQENEPMLNVPQLTETSGIKTTEDTTEITVGPPIATKSPLANVKNQTVTMPPIGGMEKLTMKSSTEEQQEQLKQNLPRLSMTNTGLMSTIDYENLDFFHGISIYVDKEHFPEEFYTQMISECEAAQGHVVSSTYRDPVDYAIVSFERTIERQDLPVNARHIVTELYVEMCMKQNKLVPVEYYHKFVPKTADEMPLKGMTIVISIYTDLERDFIEAIAQLLGARVNSTFIKKERPLLVCPEPKGSKYMGAIKWEYPVVISAWLVECANTGLKIPYQEYLVGDSPSDFPATTPPIKQDKKSRSTATEIPTSAKAIKQDKKIVSAASIAAPFDNPNEMDIDTVENNDVVSPKIATDAAEFTPLRNRRVSELAIQPQTSRNSVQNVATATDSPHTPINSYSRPSYNIDFMETLLAEMGSEAERECLREVIMEIKKNQTPELERIRRQAYTPINRKIPTPKGIPEFCTTPEFEKRLADEFERRWRLPTKKMKPNTPIDEIRRRVMKATAKALGVPISDEEDELPGFFEHGSPEPVRKRPSNATEGPQESINITPLQRKLNHAATSGASRSIFKSQSLNSSQTNDSGLYVPDTQSPNANTSSIGQCAIFNGKSTINFDKISFEDTDIGAGTSKSALKRISDATNASTSPEVKQITDYLKSCESRRQSMKKSAARGSNQNQHLNDMETETHYVQPFESEQFGMGTEHMVEWRDPGEFGLQRRSRVTSTMQYKGTPHFSISCNNEEVRDDLISKIVNLGGKVSENLVNFDPDCTHFLCEKPNRGEKMLGCMSSGKWVLSLKYIEECYARDTFVDEERYEWGNSKALNLPQLTADEQLIGQAAHRWRKDLSNLTDKNAGAFNGIRAILRISERSLDAVKNVIKAGKGVVIDAVSPFTRDNGAHLATHCFIDVKKMPLSKNDYEFLRENDVRIYNQMYIHSFLMNGRDADFTKHEVKI